MYNEQKVNSALTKENQNANNKSAEKAKKKILKLQPTVTRRRKLREVVRKRGKVPLYPYFHPYALESREC